MATTAVLAASSTLATLVTLPVSAAPTKTRALIWFLVFLPSLMAGVPASEPFMRRAAERRAKRRGEA